jgi:hypothetical protein
MTAEQAAAQLDQQLRGYPWYVSVGIGETVDGQTIFVYVRSSRHPELGALKDGWMGYKVMVRAVGSVRAIRKPLATQLPKPLTQHA